MLPRQVPLGELGGAVQSEGKRTRLPVVDIDLGEVALGPIELAPRHTPPGRGRTTVPR